MKKESYEKMRLDITEFETEDIIVTSGETPGPQLAPGFNPGEYEGPSNDIAVPGL